MRRSTIAAACTTAVAALLLSGYQTTQKTFPPPDPTVTPGFLSVDLSLSPLKLEGIGTEAEWAQWATVVPYEKSAYWKNYVCGSNQNGLTCWQQGSTHQRLGHHPFLIQSVHDRFA